MVGNVQPFLLGDGKQQNLRAGQLIGLGLGFFTKFLYALAKAFQATALTFQPGGHVAQQCVHLGFHKTGG